MKNLTLKKIFGPSSAAGLALVAKVLTLCPICLGAAGGLSATAGVAVGWFSPWRIPIMLAFLGGTLFPLALQGKHQGRWLPLLLGLAASAGIVVGGLVWSNPVLLWTGIAILTGASLWQAVVQRASQRCSRCDISDQPNKKEERQDVCTT